MGVEVDVEAFLYHCQAMKPPFLCPFEGCGKTYKSYAGIKYHFDHTHVEEIPVPPVDGHDQSSGKKKRRESRNKESPCTPDYGSSARETLTYAEAQRMIEVDIDGRMHRINICEPIPIIRFDARKHSTDHPDMTGDVAIALEGSTSTPVGTMGEGDTNKTKGKGGKNGLSSGRSKSKGGSKFGNKLSKNKNKNQKTLNTSITPAPALKLPVASFRRVEDPIALPNLTPRPAAYFRFVEKSAEELDESVEYDMDEEDCAWLEIINKQRKADKMVEVSPDTMEMLMDRLEKESYFLSQNGNNGNSGPSIDEDAVCCICNDGDCQNSNAILFCDMCDLAVHQECYGVPYIPEGQWLCRRCLHSPSVPVDCVLCPNKGGAFKQTDQGQWAHVVCAIWIPEVCFSNTVFLEPIDSVGSIPQARWKLVCYICKQKGSGACIQCHKQSCYVAFHVTCAQSSGLYMQIDLEKGSGVANIRKEAYCHTHRPNDDDPKQNALTNVYSNGDAEDESSLVISSKNQCKSEAEFKAQLKKVRKTLAENRVSVPVISIPTIPPERLTAIASKIQFPKRNNFIQKLVGYWTLKRQSRNGVPLLRRLQISYGSRKQHGDGEPGEPIDRDTLNHMKEQQQSMLKLRQDLEKVRLLIELVRKREKTKRQDVEVLQHMTELHIRPFRRFLLHLVSVLEAKDTNKFFSQPVSLDDVPDYTNFIEYPMDFETMRLKVERMEYTSVDQLEHDFDLIVKNCKEYNTPDTMYFKAAVRIKELCRSIFKEARNKIQFVGYNQSAGLHDPPVDLGLSSHTSSVEEALTKRNLTCLLNSSIPSPLPIIPKTQDPSTIRLDVDRGKEMELKEEKVRLETACLQVIEARTLGPKIHKLKRLKDQLKLVNEELFQINSILYPLPDEDGPEITLSSLKKSSSTRKESPLVTGSSVSRKRGLTKGSSTTSVTPKIKNVKDRSPKKTPPAATATTPSPSKSTPRKRSAASDSEATDLESPIKKDPVMGSGGRKSTNNSMAAGLFAPKGLDQPLFMCLK